MCVNGSFRLCSSALVYHLHTSNTGQELTLKRQDATANDLESENLAQVWKASWFYLNSRSPPLAQKRHPPQPVYRAKSCSVWLRIIVRPSLWNKNSSMANHTGEGVVSPNAFTKFPTGVFGRAAARKTRSSASRLRKAACDPTSLFSNDGTRPLAPPAMLVCALYPFLLVRGLISPTISHPTTSSLARIWLASGSRIRPAHSLKNAGDVVILFLLYNVEASLLFVAVDDIAFMLLESTI
jgi:hypothetical protein